VLLNTQVCFLAAASVDAIIFLHRQILILVLHVSRAIFEKLGSASVKSTEPRQAASNHRPSMNELQNSLLTLVRQCFTFPPSGRKKWVLQSSLQSELTPLAGETRFPVAIVIRMNRWGTLRWGTLGTYWQLAFVSGFTLLAACNGVIGGADGPGADADGTARTQAFICEDPDAIIVGSSPVRRLTNVEYENTVRDLLGGNIPQLPEQPSDAVLKGSFENNALSLSPSDVRIARYETAAISLGEHAVNSQAARDRVLPCQTTDAACGRQFVESFGKRAFRRPLTDDEFERWTGFFESERVAIDFDAAVQLTVTAMLQTPHFLYRLENQGSEVSADQLELSQYELASRLSYLLWETMPDDELLAAADAGELETDDQLEAQARRLLADDRARAAVRNFHRQWLYLDRVLGEDKLPELYPLWQGPVRESAKEETLRFIEDTFFNGGTVGDLFTSNVAYVDGVMAELYDVPTPSQPWSRIELDPQERAGLLSRIAFLAGNAHNANGSPPLRGVYLMERILCEPRPSPPADANVSPPVADPARGPMTNRQLFEERVAPSTCQGCHVRIDGFGYGFENYDAAGQFRTEDNGLPVDASGFATGIGNEAEYEGAVELQGLLAESDVVRDCVVKQWFTYANGRTMEPADTCQVEAIQRAFAENDGNLVDLLLSIVTRPEFRLRSKVED